MVLFGLTVIVVESTSSNTAVSLLILTFLVPAVLFSAVAGVYVDRIDRRLILIATNFLRGARVRRALPRRRRTSRSILLLNIFVSTVTVFFAPAELAMIPVLVAAQPAARRERHLHADAQRRVRPRVRAARPARRQRRRVPRRSSSSSPASISWPAIFCITLPASPPPPTAETDPHSRLGVGEAEKAVESTFGQLREGFGFIRANRAIGWSLIYLAITASLVGVLGVLGPDFAQETLGLAAKDFAVVVLPLGFGIVTGILLLNSYGRYFAAPAGHRGRPDRARDPARGAGGGRARSAASSSAPTRRAGSTCRA